MVMMEGIRCLTALENRIDYRLIERCLKEDQRAQSELYKLLYKQLIGTCWRYASDKEQAIEYMNLGFVRILLPIERWSVFASIGTKLWADYGFGSGPAQLDPVIGLGVNYKWRKKMSYQLSGQFFTVSGVAAPYVSTQRQYDEGFSETTYSYHTDRFYHAGLSLGASYRLSNKHSVGLFAETTALLTADNRIETGTSSSYESRTNDEVQARGYVQGFRSIQQSIGVSYEYALGKNKSLGACYRQGLTDVTRNSYFGNEMQRNSMLSIYFKMKLTR